MTAPDVATRIAMPMATRIAIAAQLVAAPLLAVHWTVFAIWGGRALIILIPSMLIDIGLTLGAAFLVWKGSAAASILVTVVAVFGVIGLGFNLDVPLLYVTAAAEIVAAIAVWFRSARRYGVLRREARDRTDAARAASE